MSSDDGDDQLVGNAGSDYLFGGSGSDTTAGNSGEFDSVWFDSASQGVVVDLFHGTAEGYGSDTISSSEVVIGSLFDDVIRGDGEGIDILAGLTGNDTLVGRGGLDLAAFLGPGILPETTPIDANLTTGEAHGEGDDTLQGIELLGGSELGDHLAGDAESNILLGLGGDDTLDGRGGKDVLTGDAGSDTLNGGVGGDVLRGGVGNDIVNGGGGHTPDTLNFDTASAPVTVNLDAGTASGDGSDIVMGIESVTGSEFDDHLRGDSLPNLLVGGGGNDSLIGRAASDYLRGDQGSDDANGGSGRDTCQAENRVSCAAPNRHPRSSTAEPPSLSLPDLHLSSRPVTGGPRNHINPIEWWSPGEVYCGYAGGEPAVIVVAPRTAELLPSTPVYWIAELRYGSTATQVNQSRSAYRWGDYYSGLTSAAWSGFSLNEMGWWTNLRTRESLETHAFTHLPHGYYWVKVWVRIHDAPIEWTARWIDTYRSPGYAADGWSVPHSGPCRYQLRVAYSARIRSASALAALLSCRRVIASTRFVYPALWYRRMSSP